MAYAATKPDEGTFNPRYGPKPDLHNFSLYAINGFEDMVVALDERRIGSTSGRYFLNWFANKPNSFKLALVMIIATLSSKALFSHGVLPLKELDLNWRMACRALDGSISSFSVPLPSLCSFVLV